MFRLFKRRSNPGAGIAQRSKRMRERFDKDDDGFQGRRVGGSEDDLELNAFERQRAIRKSRKLYRTSPAYGAVIDRFAQHVIGDGLVMTVDHPAAQEWLNAQFAKPENNWPVWVSQKIRTLIVDGELVPTITTPTRMDGTPSSNFTLGRLDIEGIESLRSHPFNHDAVMELAYKSTAFGERLFGIAGPGVKPEKFQVPRDPNDQDAGTFDFSTGLQFWRANTLGVRSGPLFTRILDKSDTLESFLAESLRKVEYANRFWLHVTYDKANDEGMGEDSKDLAFEEMALKWATEMEPGAALVTGKDVEVDAIAPTMNASDTQAIYEMTLDYILGSEGIPRHWFSSGGDTNRATAAEQGSPIYRAVSNYQAYIAALFTQLGDYLIWLGEMAGLPWTASDLTVTVTMSDVANRDTMLDAKEVLEVTTAMGEAVVSGAISDDERAAIIRATIASKSYGDNLEDAEDREAAEEVEARDDSQESEPADLSRADA